MKKPFICARHFTAERQFHSPQEGHTDTMLIHLPVKPLTQTLHVSRTLEVGQRENQGEVWDLAEEHLKITF